jgi:hypothetical protein
MINSRVELLIAMSFKPLYLSKDDVLKLSIEFFDGDDSNVLPENLVWRFPPDGLLSSTWDGFRIIPCYTRYLINEAGDVRSRITGEALTAGISPTGYVERRLVRDDGVGVILHTHRALGLAFKDYPTQADVWHINHINGIKTDNSLNNLEWVTKEQNVQHARLLGLMRVTIPVKVMDIYSNEITTFSNMAAVAKHFGVSNSHVWQALKTGIDYRVFKDRYILSDGSKPLPTNANYLISRSNTGKPKQVLVTHVNENRTEAINSASGVLKIYPDVTKKQLYTALKNGSDRVISGKTFKYLT